LVKVYVAAGSNIDPVANLRAALAALERRYGSLEVSPAYRNKAVGFEGDDFINLVCGFETSDSPARVREHLQQVEALCGRAPDAPKWAPRSIDLDILMYGQLINDQPGLIFPRPDLARRAYMLRPMADLAPDLPHPILGKTMRELWDAFDRDAHPLVSVPLE
jgi:2-amino-4-hydroxy-6-hydroxymethyldihydropteridine diphosphokinase